MTNTVCTFFELTEGEDTVGQPFHGLERELLLKSLRALEKQHKAEIFESEDGVKFFQL
jgi:ESCRT-II complex subunit VPS25